MAADQTKDLFFEALDLPAAERAGFLDSVCDGDEARRGRLERLVRAHEGAGAFMADFTSDGDATPSRVTPPDYGPGDRIDSYRLVRPLGEGGPEGGEQRAVSRL